MKRTIYDEEHEAFRDTVRGYIETELVPHAEKWEAERLVDRSAYVAAGKHGLIGFNMPEEYGGGGSDDFRFNAVVVEEFASYGGASPAFSLQNDVVGPYFVHLANDEQKQRWIPGIASGETILAVAMTEPGAGSDLAGITTSARRDGDDWILNGSKTFISSGINSDLVVVVCRTDPDPAAKHKAFSLLVVERGMPGFERGRKLDKIGLKAQDTAELHFDDVRVPAENLLGQENLGFYHLMQNLPSERLSIGISAIAGARAIFEENHAVGAIAFDAGAKLFLDHVVVAKTQTGFEGVGQDGGALRATALGFAIREAQHLGQTQIERQAVQAVFAHQVGADAGQVALVGAGIALVQQAGDSQAQHRVAQEFQALVVVAAEAAVR